MATGTWRAMQSTHLTEKMLHILDGLEHLAQGITIFDQHLKLVAWNSRFLQIYDYPEGLAFPGADFASFIAHNAAKGDYGPGDVDTLVAERVRIAREFRKHRLERALPDGTTIEIAGSPLANGGFVTTYTDITDVARQREMLRDEVAQKTAALQLSEARLKMIADEVPAGIAHIDRGMNILYANKRFAGAYGRQPSEVTGLHSSELLAARTLEESSAFFEQARRGAQVDFEMRIELPGQRFKDIRTLLRPERPSSGEVIGFYLVSIDVTRSKATMSALMRSQKMDALGRMASGISHDFNNLLTVILGNLTPLAEQLDDEALVEGFLVPAISAARRGSSLTSRLLTLARREQFDPEPTNICEAVEEISKLLVSSLPDGLKLEVVAGSDLPLALVDRAQLEMALLNMALNARDATKGRGRITIDTSAYTLHADEAHFFHMRAGEYIRIRFSDDGCGMSPELAEKIFEPFVTSKAAGSGSGLGLSMVYGFVRQSNGAIWVESAPDAGTKFTILLPSAELAADARVITRLPKPPPLPLPEQRDRDDKTPRLILLVEDDRDVRRTIRNKIARLGHHMVEAGTADEALDLLAQVEGIDIVVSDIDMPGSIDGIELANRLRGSQPRLPVILMSGNTRFLSAGAPSLGVPFLPKPFSVEDMRLALEQAIRATHDKEITP